MGWWHGVRPSRTALPALLLLPLGLSLAQGPWAPQPGVGAIAVAAHLVGAAAVVLGVRRHRPSLPAVWWAFGAALLVGAVAGIAGFGPEGGASGPPPQAEWALLGTHLLLLGALLAANPRRMGSPPRGEDALDGLIIATAIGLAVAMLLRAPGFGDPAGGLEVVVALRGVTATLVLLQLAGICLVADRLPAALRILATGITLFVLGDIAHLARVVEGSAGTVPTLLAAWVALPAAAGLASLHPTMTDLTAPRHAARPVRARQISYMAVALLLNPGLVVAQGLRGAPIPAGGWAAGYLLVGLGVLVRFTWLLGTAERSARRATDLLDELQHVSDAMAEREQDSRLLAEEAEETLERYHLALEAGGLAIWDWDVDASSIRRSPDAEALFGLPRESTGPAELLFLRRVHPDDRARVLPVVRKAAATGDPFTLEYRLVLPDGRIRHVVDVGRPGARSAGSKRMHGAMKDVTAEREAQEALREREAASRAVLDSLPAETVVVARDGTILAANTAWLGGSAGDDGTVWPVGENYLERWASRPGLSPRMRAATLDGIRAVMARTATEHVQEYDVEPAGRWFELRVLPLHASSGDVIISHYDITDRKAVEAALRHSQKMESLGQLAGGVAHDFNNLLTAISGYAELARERLAAGELSAASTELHELERAAGRGAELVAQLLAFSRRRPAKVEPARAGDTIAGLQSLLGRLLGAHVRVEVSVADSGVVPVDATQLEQVVINLAVNARDAMPAGGSVTISTRDVVVDGGRGETADLAPGPYVELEVRDSGCGMPPEVLAHVWEPFFTTKGEAGTGLGLPMVYGTVTQAGGQVTIESEPGEGTSVRILLPRRARTATAGGAASAPSAPAPPPGQAVLLVEDQAQVRHLLTAALERLGYSVLSASDGPSALDLVEGGADVDLLLTDVVMPAMNGVELAERMRARLPGVRVLFMSGYTHDVAVHDAGGLSFLQKPFSLTELATAVREAIADQPADG